MHYIPCIRYIYIYTHSYIHECTTHTHPSIHPSIHASIRPVTQPASQPCVHTHTHQNSIYTYIYTYTCICVHKHTDIHLYKCMTCTCTSVWRNLCIGTMTCFVQPAWTANTQPDMSRMRREGTTTRTNHDNPQLKTLKPTHKKLNMKLTTMPGGQPGPVRPRGAE